MSLSDKRNAGVRGERQFGEPLGECPAGFKGAEVAAFARRETVPELVDRPQVDARGVQSKAVAVIEAGVFAEPVQEDDGGSGLGLDQWR